MGHHTQFLPTHDAIDVMTDSLNLISTQRSMSFQTGVFRLAIALH